MRGLGIIRCNACGEPLRDHDRKGPCPAMGEQVFHVARPGRPVKTDPVSVRNAERRKAHRDRQKENR